MDEIATKLKPPQSELWPHQKEGIEKIEKWKRIILADQPGVAKTRQVLEVMRQNLDPDDPILIICSTKATPTWLMQIRLWAPEWDGKFVLTEGRDPIMRRRIWRENKHIITNHQIIIRDFKLIPKDWKMIVLDEYHRWLRNRGSKSHKALKALGRYALYFVPVSGTPSAKGPKNFWTILNILWPNTFTSYWRFVNQWCYVDITPFGKEVYGNKSKENFKKFMQPYIIRRMKADVFPDMPPKLVQKVPVVMTKEQKRFHSQLKENFFASIGSDLVLTPNAMTAIMRLRQMLVTPRILSNDAGYGAGIEYILDHIDGLETEDCHFAIFTPFRAALPVVREALATKNVKTTFLQGGMSSRQVAEALHEYDTERTVAVSTIKAAESYSLASSSYAFMLGAEWEYIENEQAEDRMHRPESTETVNIYYLYNLESIEEDLFDSLDDDFKSLTGILNSPRRIIKALKKTEML